MENTKITLRLPSDLVEELRKLSIERNTSMTEVIRRGLETDLYLTKEENDGAKILLEKGNNRIVQLVRK